MICWLCGEVAEGPMFGMMEYKAHLQCVYMRLVCMTRQAGEICKGDHGYPTFSEIKARTRMDNPLPMPLLTMDCKEARCEWALAATNR